MTNISCRATRPAALLCAAAILIGPGLASCSGEGERNAAEQNATEETPAASVAAEQGGNTQDATAQNAKALLKRMSDYLDAQKAISLNYDAIFEVVSADRQKLQIATSGTVLLQRPDKIRTTRKAGFADTEMVFDGKTLSFLGKGSNAYVQTEVPGTIDNLIDQLRDKFHRQLPGADLLQSGVYEALMTDVTDVKDLGSGVISGQECDHLAFRAKETDWQIWIAQGPTPYPCRYVITSKTVDQAPEFTLEVRDWKAGSDVVLGNLSFTPPAGARKLDVKDLQALKDAADLPDNYRIGAAQ